MEVKCEACGKLFNKEGHRVNRTKSGKHFCSRECYLTMPISGQEKTGEEVKCGYCGSVVYRPASHIKNNKTGKFFCSKQCSGKYITQQSQSDHNAVCNTCGTSFRRAPSCLGENNYCSRDCWKEGIKSTGVPAYRKHKKDVCDMCGFIPVDKCQLDVHHDNLDSNDHSEENLITLCANCHRLVHKQLRDAGSVIIPQDSDTCELE